MGKLVYVCMNVIEAVEISRKEYCETRGWIVPENENPDERVMMVTYADGYISMCPKDKFYAVSIECDEGRCTFGYAITECRYHGKRIKRAGWDGEDQYVEFCKCATLMEGEDKELEINSFCFVFHSKNRHTGEAGIQLGWLASQMDMAANDWVVMD